MKNKHKNSFFFFLSIALSIISCNPEDRDDEYPVIDISIENAFPQNCDTLFRGEYFTFQAKFTDNAELGAYTLNIHHNFDHHSHSSFDDECEMDPIKDPVNPLVLIEKFSIPGGSTSYLAEDIIWIPAIADTGDYHFQVFLTDREGWQEIIGISIKIIDH